MKIEDKTAEVVEKRIGRFTLVNTKKNEDGIVGDLIHELTIKLETKFYDHLETFYLFTTSREDFELYRADGELIEFNRSVIGLKYRAVVPKIKK